MAAPTPTPTPPPAPAPASAAVASARLDHDTSQAVFRCLLDALARPGRPGRIPAAAAPGVPRALVPVLALADVDAAVAVLADDHAGWADVIRTVTGAHAAALPLAPLVVALRPPTPAEVASLERGEPAEPERGARLIVGCRSLAADGAADASGDTVTVDVAGPGVPGVRRVVVSGLDGDVLRTLAQVNQGYPAGIDTWLVADDGTLVGLPRSVTLTLEAN